MYWDCEVMRSGPSYPLPVIGVEWTLVRMSDEPLRRSANPNTKTHKTTGNPAPLRPQLLNLERTG